MVGRAFLDTAERLSQGQTEADWRSAAGRAYYGLMLECRDALQRWGFLIPRRDQLHAFVRQRFAFPADPDLKRIGDELERLGRLRNIADYQLQFLRQFRNASDAVSATKDARTALALLDAIDTTPTRQAVAIAAIQKAFPP